MIKHPKFPSEFLGKELAYFIIASNYSREEDVETCYLSDRGFRYSSPVPRLWRGVYRFQNCSRMRLWKTISIENTTKQTYIQTLHLLLIARLSCFSFASLVTDLGRCIQITPTSRISSVIPQLLPPENTGGLATFSDSRTDCLVAAAMAWAILIKIGHLLVNNTYFLRRLGDRFLGFGLANTGQGMELNDMEVHPLSPTALGQPFWSWTDQYWSAWELGNSERH